MTSTLAQLGSRLWMPDAVSSYADQIDWLFYFIYWISAGAFLVIMAVTLYFVVRYRARPGHREEPSPAHNTGLEVAWTIVPAGVFLAIFYFGFRGFLAMATPPDYAYEINVIAYKWGWTFQYPNGATSDELHVPVDRPIKLILQSEDVIHSLFIPAFRTKKDAVPGRYNSTWFQPLHTGTFELYCAEYCGQNHSEMRTRVVVHEPEAFSRWLEQAANWLQSTPPVAAGEKLYSKLACYQCHSIDGSAGTGPSFRNLFGHQHALRGGGTVTVDENYIRESILNPSAKVVAGFQDQMTSYQGRIKDQEITAIIEFLKSLSDKGPRPMEAWPAAGTQPAATRPAGER